MGEVDPHVWDRFDMVAVLSYTEYRDRQPALWAELERLGLKDRAEWFWNFPSPFTERFANSLRISDSIGSIGAFSCAMGHYRIIKTARALGRSQLLVLEDDVRFVKDAKLLERAVRELPDNYDVAKFEWFIRNGNFSPVSDVSWLDPRGSFSTYGGAATAYSSRGMEWKTNAMEKAARYTELHSQLWTADSYETERNMRGLNLYVSCPCVAVQSESGLRSGSVHRGSWSARYGRQSPEGGMSAFAP